MYTFITATCLSKTIGSQWEQKPQLNTELVYRIYEKNKETYLTLSHPDLTGEIYVNMDVLKNQYALYAGTLSQLLVELGNTNLPTVPTIPVTTLRYAKYSDAIRSGYKIKTTIAGLNLPENFPDDGKHDLEITRPQFTTEMSLLHSHTLVSVNGFYHMTDTDGTKAYVMDGAISMRRSNQNHLGIWSFMDVGRLKKIKIAPEDIKTETETSTLKDKIIFTVDEALDDKSYIMILGGYMVMVQNGVFWRNGEKSFAIDIKQIPYVERIFESNRYIDLSPLGLTEIPQDPEEGYSIPELYSDEVLRKYMTLSQSFLVLIDIPFLSYRKIPVKHYNRPGFTSYQDPVYPLLVTYGKTAEYWKTPEDGFWSVTVVDVYTRNYITSQRPETDQNIVTSNMLAGSPFYPSRGFLFELAGYRTD